jgi:aspartate-semialdehyde dehydrogenase
MAEGRGLERLRVGVLGATGLVGQEILRVLEERRLAPRELVLLASERSAGRELSFRGRPVRVQAAAPELFAGLDLVIASAGAAASRELLPLAVAHGAVAVDNSSAFRAEPDVPLVVPEVNPHRIAGYRARGLVANPNCSTIQLVLALGPIADAAGLRRVVVATYQSVSGAGRRARDELLAHSAARLDGREPETGRRSLAFDLVPEIGAFGDGGDSQEEWKLRFETQKILEREVAIHATCVRVPVLRSHGEAVWVETERPLSPEAAARLLERAPGVVLHPGTGYATAREAAGRDAVHVGRLRRDPSVPNGLSFWVVADNLRKGAATNAVQIAELVAAHMSGEPGLREGPPGPRTRAAPRRSSATRG